MLHRVPFDRKKRQEHLFLARRSRLPLPGELSPGPVVEIDVHYSPPNGRPTHLCAVAMVDTGADRTVLRAEFALPLVVRAHAGGTMPFSFHAGAGAFSSPNFALSLGGRKLPSPSDVLIAFNPPGYEDMLLGRDVLDHLTICFSGGRFSLIAGHSHTGTSGSCCHP